MKTLSVSMKHLVQYWHYQHFGHQYHPLTQTNNLLVTINSSVNFIIYCIFGHKFKRIFLSLVCSLVRGRGRPRPGDLSRVYTWASISLHVYIRVTSGGLLRFHSQHKMSHQQEHSHVSLQLAVTQPGDTRWEYSVTRVIHTCHVSVFCAKTPKVPHYMHCIVSLSEHWRWRMQCRIYRWHGSAQLPPDGPDAAGAGRGAAEGGAGEQLQLGGGGVRPLPRGQCSPIVTSIYIFYILHLLLAEKLNI